jgi:hypothetical protein
VFRRMVRVRAHWRRSVKMSVIARALVAARFMTLFRVGRRAVIILTELTIGRRSNELRLFR